MCFILSNMHPKRDSIPYTMHVGAVSQAGGTGYRLLTPAASRKLDTKTFGSTSKSTSVRCVINKHSLMDLMQCRPTIMSCTVPYGQQWAVMQRHAPLNFSLSSLSAGGAAVMHRTRMKSVLPPRATMSSSTAAIVPPVASMGSHTKMRSSGANLAGSLFRYSSGCGAQPPSQPSTVMHAQLYRLNGACLFLAVQSVKSTKPGPHSDLSPLDMVDVACLKKMTPDDNT